MEYIRPGPSIRYKAMGGLLSVIRPGPYMRGNTVGQLYLIKDCSPSIALLKSSSSISVYARDIENGKMKKDA